VDRGNVHLDAKWTGVMCIFWRNVPSGPG